MHKLCSNNYHIYLIYLYELIVKKMEFWKQCIFFCTEQINMKSIKISVKIKMIVLFTKLNVLQGDPFENCVSFRT